VRTAKDTGLDRFPSQSWTVNQAWCAAITIAVDLICWLHLLAGTGLAAAEPKTLRYRLLLVPPPLIRARRYRWLRLPRTWPWAADLATASAAYPCQPPDQAQPAIPTTRRPRRPRPPVLPPEDRIQESCSCPHPR